MRFSSLAEENRHRLQWESAVADTRIHGTTRQQVPGRFSTQPKHILPEKISGIERGTTSLLNHVDGTGPQASPWAQAMLEVRGIQGVPVRMGLLSLKNQHARPPIERACEVAAGHGAHHLRSLRPWIEQGPKAPVQQNFEVAEEPPILRPVADDGPWWREALSQQPLTQQECVTGDLRSSRRCGRCGGRDGCRAGRFDGPRRPGTGWITASAWS